MPNINLIADRREEKKRLERTTRQLFMGLAASVGAVGLLVIYLGTMQYTAAGELASLAAKMQQLQPTLDRIAQVEQDTGELTPKVDTLVSARDATMRWRALLQVVSQSIPEGVWLSNLSSTGSTVEDTSLLLTGMAGTQALVGKTMTQLQSHPIFADDSITLSYTQNSVSGDPTATPRFNFEISARLRPPAPAPAPAKDGAAKSASRVTAPAAGAAARVARKGNTDGKSA